MSKWASRLKNQKVGGEGPTKPTKAPFVGNVSSGGGTYSEISTPFVSNVSTTPPSFGDFHGDPTSGIEAATQAQVLSPSSAGNDIPSSNDEIFNPGIPSDLFELAVRYCTELHGDDAGQVREMIDDLLAVPDDWNWWALHFRRALGIPREVRCGDCLHCQDTGGNLGRCRKDISGPEASSLWWMTDTHPCIQFSAIQEAT